jgi:flavin reductase (DIM6/NTAB) family NADH-FMN oxidoreductase RutF
VNVQAKFFPLNDIVMITIDPKSIPVPKLQGYLQGTVSPRPIAFVSSTDRHGNINLSPFSFFNMFSMNPPILVFSPSRRVRDNSTKHTLQNVLEVPEVVINIISYEMVEQASLSSCDFPKGANEFVKAGFTVVPSLQVKPPRVGESKAAFECKVNQVIPLGTEGGAGNLVICEVLLFHVSEEIIDTDGRINPHRLDAVARMGSDYYCRASGDSVFVVPKPNEKIGIGFDNIPLQVRKSKVLTGNDLGRLGNVEKLPDEESVLHFKSSTAWNALENKDEEARHLLAQQFLQQGNIEDAWKVLLLKS